MNPRQKDIDKRESYRCQVPQGQEHAELQIGRQRTSIRLFNESAGGFAAMVEGNPGIKVDDVLKLTTSMGRFEARVAYLSQVMQASSGQKQEEPLLRIGLERLGDLPAEAQPNRASTSWPTMTVLAVGCVALVIVAVALGIAAMASGPDGPVRPPSVTSGERNTSDLAAEPAPPEALSQLGLSDAQQQQIQEAAAVVAGTFQELDGQWNDDTPGQRASKQATVWDAARRGILNRLTDEQRKRWEQSFY